MSAATAFVDLHQVGEFQVGNDAEGLAFFDAQLFRDGRHAGPGEAIVPRVVGEHLQRLAVSEGQSLRSVGALAQPPRKEGLIRLPLTLVVRFP